MILSMIDFLQQTRIHAWCRACIAIGWPVLLILLPVTTPTFWGCGPGQIRPPAGVFALLLLLPASVLYWRSWRNDTVIRRLILFGLYAVGFGAVVVLVDPPLLAGKPSAMELYIKAILALGTGFALYLVARASICNQADLRRTLFFLIIGLGLSVALAVAQVLSLLEMSWIRGFVVFVSSLICPLYDITFLNVPHGGRGHGLAYEPSYLASQLTLLLLPLGWWAVRTKALLLGHVALSIAMLGIFFSGSRGGILMGVVVFSVGGIWLTITGAWRQAVLAICISGACATVGWLEIKRLAYVETSIEAVRARLHVDADGQQGWLSLLIRVNLAPRATAAVSACAVFTAHPLCGSGLGLAPLEMPRHFPAWSLGHEEPQRVKNSGEEFLLYPMAMLIRIPAELGIIGVLLITWFLAGHRLPVWKWREAKAPLAASLLMALFFDSFLISSFAMPAFALAVAMLAVVDTVE